MYDFLSNTSRIPNNPLRAKILEAANDYIGEVYAYDKGPNYLAIDRTDLSVKLTNVKFPESPFNNWEYYDAISIVQPVNALQIEPDQLAIDAVTLDFYPIERLENFRKTAIDAITKFIIERGWIPNAVITFPIDSFNVQVVVPEEIETVDSTEVLDESFDEMDAVEWVDVPLKDYVRFNGDKITINMTNLLKVALDNYYED